MTVEETVAAPTRTWLDRPQVDVLVLAREAGGWRVVFRTMAPPKPAAAPATP